MDRSKRFTDLYNGTHLQTAGVNQDDGHLESMIEDMRAHCFSEALCQEIAENVIDTSKMTNDLKLIGALGEYLIQVCSRHTVAQSMADDTGSGSVHMFTVA